MRLHSTFFTVLSIFFFTQVAFAQESHALSRQWNEEVLNAIRNDFARPTVHARNLYHTSMAMYDIWATYHDGEAETLLLGKTIGEFECPFEGIEIPEDPDERRAAMEKAMSFAMYRIINYRFRFSPGYFNIRGRIDGLMSELGYDRSNADIDYQFDTDPAVFGNYVATCVLQYGLSDQSNELDDFTNQVYQPVNDPLVMVDPGNPDINDPNHWQPLTLDVFIDQAGNEIPFNTPDFLGPEWGVVTPFALDPEDLTIYERDGADYYVYHDPGTPPMVGEDGYLPEEYIWGFSMVATWASHLDPADSVMWDISPNSLGNTDWMPNNFEDYDSYYDYIEGGDPGTGRRMNPHTGQPYEVQMVPRGDYARVLAEFWADGPDSETPPGHWFTILNEVMDHPDFSYAFEGEGEPLDTLEYEVKAYLTLGGAMHDCAISAWGVKGWYDYIRPVSAIRYMADQGQSTYPDSAYYSPNGMPIVPGLIEVVTADDSLAMLDTTNIGKIKIMSWRGPDFIEDPETDVAGVGWMLAENWWPYQRPSFVTPPFAGYVSGHSTFSRAAAEVLTMMTGDEYFPGGMGVFPIEKNEFLVFEDGPSVDFELQWATYRDASDQTSLSRIWGGIHPPADDIPGRMIGIEVGLNAYAKARDLFGLPSTSVVDLPVVESSFSVYPNPVSLDRRISVKSFDQDDQIRVVNVTTLTGAVVRSYSYDSGVQEAQIDLPLLASGQYYVQVASDRHREILPIMIVE